MVFKIAIGYSNKLGDNGYSLEEQGVIYNLNLEDLLLHTRWYLDNLDSLVTYKVGWHNYNSRNKRTPVPFRLKKR